MTNANLDFLFFWGVAIPSIITFNGCAMAFVMYVIKQVWRG